MKFSTVELSINYIYIIDHESNNLSKKDMTSAKCIFPFNYLSKGSFHSQMRS